MAHELARNLADMAHPAVTLPDQLALERQNGVVAVYQVSPIGRLQPSELGIINAARSGAGLSQSNVLRALHDPHLAAGEPRCLYPKRIPAA